MNTLLKKQLWGKLPNVSKLRQLNLKYKHIPVFTKKPSNYQMLLLQGSLFQIYLSMVTRSLLKR